MGAARAGVVGALNRAVRSPVLRRNADGSLSMFLNSVTLIVAKVSLMGLGFLAWITVARLLPPAEVGLASGAVSAVTLCAQIALLGVGSSVISLYGTHERSPSRLLDTATGIVTLAALAAAAGFLAVAGTWLQELRVVAANPLYAAAFVVLAAAGTIGVLFDQASTVLRRGHHALIRNVVAGSVTLALAVALPLLVSGADSFVVFTAWVAGSIAMVTLGIAQLRSTLGGYVYRPRLDGTVSRSLLRIGLPNYALTLAERAPGPLLPIIVTELLSPTANAYWYAVWMMAWVVFVIPIQVGMTVFAEAAYRPARIGDAIRQGLRSSLALGVAGALLLIVFAEFALSLLGPSYAAAGAGPLRILVLAVIPTTFIQAYFATCRATRRLGEAIATGVAAGAAGVVAASVAGVTFGLTGIAVAWLLTQSIAAVWAGARLRVLAADARTLPAADSADAISVPEPGAVL